MFKRHLFYFPQKMQSFFGKISRKNKGFLDICAKLVFFPLTSVAVLSLSSEWVLSLGQRGKKETLQRPSIHFLIIVQESSDTPSVFNLLSNLSFTEGYDYKCSDTQRAKKSSKGKCIAAAKKSEGHHFIENLNWIRQHISYRSSLDRLNIVIIHTQTFSITTF